MLTLAERNALDSGMSWAFCDTDSLAIARPEGLDESEFQRRVRQVVDWFQPLNPYQTEDGPAPSVLQIERLNFKRDLPETLDEVFCVAISAKRYALYSRDANGEAMIRKASAHGLGHLHAPYPDPDRRVRMRAIHVEKWQSEEAKRRGLPLMGSGN